jgi:cytochrome c-type biogenesis protein CcmH
MRVLFYISLSLTLSFGAAAQISDAEVEARAKEVAQSLRCVVCQNQTIDESDAPLAIDMRKLVRDRLREGDSNTEVIDYMQERYGDYVLLKPPLQNNTYILWFAPFLLLLGVLGWFFLRSGKTEESS